MCGKAQTDRRDIISLQLRTGPLLPPGAAMTQPAALLPLILTASLLGCSRARASISCTWTKSSPQGEVHLTFVQQDPHRSPPLPRLYHSAWSAERALLGCTWSDDAVVIRGYLSACRERKLGFSDHPVEGLDLGLLLEGGRCDSLASPGLLESAEKRHPRSVGGPGGRSGVAARHRVKRGFIVPGTLWCGSGNKAPSYNDLGVFSATDGCCREHDQCKDTILSFQSQYGVFNSNIFTLSHCDCDDKFRRCLKEANDQLSDVVGYTFFNLLKMNCFTFSQQLQCAKRNWFGMCKENQLSLYADVHPPTEYESSQSTEDCVNGSCSTIGPGPEPPETPSPGPQPPSTHAAATNTLPAHSGASISSVAKETASAGDDLENALPSKHLADATESCRVYKDLDGCRDKIPPRQSRYGVHNAEPRTLYSCNCTDRLFQTLSQQRQMSGLQAVLLDHVSRSCFLPQDCPDRNTSCSATVMKADLPPLDQSSSHDVAQQRHLQAARPKASGPDQRRTRRKEAPVRLYKLCVRMTRPRRTKKA